MKPSAFNIRVYFLCLKDHGRTVLVSDEIIRGKHFSKFPGGGLEFGEGTRDCVHREAMEELGQDVKSIVHFYTTDFFLRSAFNPAHQVVSIYYKAELEGEQQFRTESKRFAFGNATADTERFRWVAIDELDPEEFELPADRRVADMLRTAK
jgi:8-oxo-dGTP diphosphatase